MLLIRLRLTLAVLSLAMLSLLPPLAQAQPAGAKGDDFLYRVRQGDTLIDLANRYTGNNGNWSALQTHNSVGDPRQLPIGKMLQIPFTLIPVRDGNATLAHASGQVTVNDRPATPGSAIAEGATIRTGADGFATLRLEDGSILTLPANTTMTLDRLRMFERVSLSDAILDVRQGSLESHVAPEGDGVGRFEVRTPVSITGVRGTTLRVHASSEGASSEVLTGTAQVDGSQQQGIALRQNQGVAVSAQGRLSGVRNLLPPPVLQDPQRDGGGWLVSFAPVPDAAAYLVQVATDERGTQLVSSHRVEAPRAVVHARGPDTHYVLVRSLDADNLGGRDAVASFPGQLGLVSSDGTPVLSGHGLPIQLTRY